MWRMIFAHVKAAHARLSFDNVVWVGADEMNRRKGHTDLTFAEELLRHSGHPKAIRCLAINMSVAYTNEINGNLGNAWVVYDKFHVTQNVVVAYGKVRKVESRSDAGNREFLERMRWMWLNNRVNWKEKETHKWESMALEQCDRAAYEMRLSLQGIYERKDAGEAKKLVRNWCLRCIRCGSKPENCSSPWPELPGSSRVTWKASWLIGLEV